MSSLLLSAHAFPRQAGQIFQAQTELIKTYQLSSRDVLNVVIDSIKGVHAVLIINGESHEIPFNDLIGIDPQFQFNQVKILHFLEEAYPIIHPTTDGTFAVQMMLRLRGGGHSSHTRSSQAHSRSAPPPHRTAVTYGAGLTIRELQEVPVAGGIYKEQQGGVGQTKYSVIFESQNPYLRPHVIIRIWKRDKYAPEIANLNSCRSSVSRCLMEHKARLIKNGQQRDTLSAKIEEIKRRIQEKTEEEAQLSQELTKTRGELESSKAKISELEEEIKQIESTVFALKQLLELNKIKKLNLDTSHPALLQFMSHSSFIGTKVQRWLQVAQYDATLKVVQEHLSKTDTADYPTCKDSFLGSLFSMFEMIIAESNKAEGKEVVALIGNTGVGKSTTVNHLLGVKMTKNEAGKIVAADPLEEKAKIGHRPATSETEYTQIYASQEGTSFVYADCGGFLDTRSLETQIAVASSVKFTLEKARGIKLVLCVDYPKISLDRGVHFSKFLEDSLGEFVKKYENKKQSILLIITKTNGASTEEVKEAIEELRKDIDPSNIPLKTLYNFICREEGKYIDLCDPLLSESRETIHLKLAKMTPIQGESFRVLYSDAGKLKIVEEMILTAGKYNDLSKRYRDLVTQKKSLEEKEAKLTGGVKLAQLEKQNQETYLPSQVTYLEAITALIKITPGDIGDCEKHIQSFQEQLSKMDTADYVEYNSYGGDFIETYSAYP